MDPMNAALVAQIVKRLKAIADLLRAIRDHSSRILENFSASAIDAAVRQRALILLRIEDEREALLKIRAPHFWNGYDEYKEIQSHINAITRLDKEAAALARLRMNEMRRELSSLTDTSCAAKVYTRNSRF
jgi:hypothetical protein